jgi:hypothetical protein
MADTIPPINAAHEVLIASPESLCADTIAARGKLNKKATTAQLKELSRAGLIEMLPGKGGVPYYGLTQTSTPVVPDKPGVSVTTPDAQGEAYFTPFTAQACARPENAPVEVAPTADTGGDGYILLEDSSPVLEQLATIAEIATPYTQGGDGLAADGVKIMNTLIAIQNTAISNAEALTGKLEALLDSKNHELEALRTEVERLRDGAPKAAQAPVKGYLVVSPSGASSRFKKPDTAVNMAKTYAKNNGKADIFILTPFGTASRGAVFNAYKGPQK